MTVTFEEQPPSGTINLGIGQPSADLLPVNLVMQASNAFFEVAEPFDLNYGVLQGDARFLDSLATYLTRGYGSDVTREQLFVTGGSSQGLDLSSLRREIVDLAIQHGFLILADEVYQLLYVASSTGSGAISMLRTRRLEVRTWLFY